MDFSKEAKGYLNAPLNRQLMMEMLKGYKRPNDKISELLQNGELTALKKGLYIPGRVTELPTPEPFLIANHLWGPSYISLETALSYWGMIPERVFETASVTMKTTKTYKTPAGRFTYRHIPSPYYAFGIQSIALSKNQVAMVASPEKAICDKIITTSGIVLRSPVQVRDFLIEDLRIDQERLATLNWKTILSWAEDAPKKNSLLMLAKTLQAL